MTTVGDVLAMGGSTLRPLAQPATTASGRWGIVRRCAGSFGRVGRRRR